MFVESVMEKIEQYLDNKDYIQIAKLLGGMQSVIELNKNKAKTQEEKDLVEVLDLFVLVSEKLLERLQKCEQNQS